MSRFDTNLDIDSSAAEFAVRKDDFSVQVSLPNDHMFWVRVESGDTENIVSDLNLGNQTPQIAAAGLACALRHAERNPFSDIRILNIAPSSDELKLRSESIRQVLAHHAATRGRFITKFEVQPVGHKYNLLVSFT